MAICGTSNETRFCFMKNCRIAIGCYVQEIIIDRGQKDSNYCEKERNKLIFINGNNNNSKITTMFFPISILDIFNFGLSEGDSLLEHNTSQSTAELTLNHSLNVFGVKTNKLYVSNVLVFEFTFKWFWISSIISIWEASRKISYFKRRSSVV